MSFCLPLSFISQLYLIIYPYYTVPEVFDICRWYDAIPTFIYLKIKKKTEKVKSIRKWIFTLIIII